MTTRTALIAAFAAVAALAARPAAAQTDTARVAATATPATPAAPAAAAARPRRNPNVITREEMQERNARNVYDGVRALHGAWLRGSRALNSVTEKAPTVAVYRDGSLVGSVNALRDMAVESVTTVSYMAPSEAMQRFGSDANGGAILVSTTH